MEISTAIAVAIVLCVLLLVPFAVFYIRRGKAHGHTWFTRWKPRGHSDIGPDVGFRQTRPGADAARGSRYCSAPRSLMLRVRGFFGPHSRCAAGTAGHYRKMSAAL